MVRRWSFIITTTKLSYSSYDVFQHFLFDTNVNNTMYLRKTYAHATVLSRRPWARRKHLSNWLIGSSILKLWSQNYRFLKNMNKFLQNVFVARNSFTTFGSSVEQYKALELFKASYNSNLSFWNKTLFTTSKFVTTPPNPTLARYTRLSPLFVAWNYSTELMVLNNFQNIVGFFANVDSSLCLYSVLHTKVTANQHYALFFSLIFRLWLLNLRFVYQSLILVLLNLLN